MTKQELAKAIVWMMDKGYTTGHGDSIVDLLQELEWQVAEREREACAKLCEELVLAYAGNASATAHQCAEEIRARGIDGAKVGEVGVWGEKEANRSQATTSAGKPNYRTPQVTPQVTPEVGLTDEERFSKDWQETVARVEAKLKEKNT